MRSANLTPDKNNRFSNWTSEQFINRFKKYTENSYVNPKIARGEFQTTMPLDCVFRHEQRGLIEAISPLSSKPESCKNQIEKSTPSKVNLSISRHFVGYANRPAQ
ncbi:MAG: hypothetical protein IPJ54_21065 [Saprospiraceae bacterium]|nr:hypothetical protein [Saprospiraceae bacterium]